MSTGLNSMSGVIYEDMIKPCLRKPISNVGASRIMKATVVIIGAICVGLVFMVEKLSGLIQVRCKRVTRTFNDISDHLCKLIFDNLHDHREHADLFRLVKACRE